MPVFNAALEAKEAAAAVVAAEEGAFEANEEAKGSEGVTDEMS